MLSRSILSLKSSTKVRTAAPSLSKAEKPTLPRPTILSAKCFVHSNIALYRPTASPTTYLATQQATYKRHYHGSTSTRSESTTEAQSEEAKKEAAVSAQYMPLLMGGKYEDALKLLQESYPDISATPPRLVLHTVVAAMAVGNAPLAHNYFVKALQEFPEKVDTSMLSSMIIKFYAHGAPVMHNWAFSRVLERFHLLFKIEGIPQPTDTTGLLEAAQRVTTTKKAIVELLNLYAYLYHAVGDNHTPIDVLRVAIKIDPKSEQSYLELLGKEISLTRTGNLKPQELLESSMAFVKESGSPMAYQFMLTAMWMCLMMDGIVEVVDSLASHQNIPPRFFIAWKVNALLAKGDKDTARKLMDESNYKVTQHASQTDKSEDSVMSVLERTRTYIMLDEHETVKAIIMDLVEKRPHLTQLERDLVINFVLAEIQQAPQLAVWILHHFLKAQPHDHTYYYMLANVEISLLGRPEMAIKIFRALEEMGRLDAHDISLLSRAYLQWQEYDKALFLCRLAQTQAPKHAGERVFEALEKKDFSIDLANREPSSVPFAHSLESTLLLRMGRYEDAIEAFERHAKETGAYCPYGSAFFGIFFAGALDRLLEEPAHAAATSSYIDDDRALKLLFIGTQFHHFPKTLALAHELATKILIKKGRSKEAEFHTKKSAEYTEAVIQSSQ